MRNDPVTCSQAANADGNAPQRLVSIDARSSASRAAVDTPARPENRDDVTSRQAAEFDIWEDEGGAIARRPLEFPGRHAGRHFDEPSG
jgi:hypothetical protein